MVILKFSKNKKKIEELQAAYENTVVKGIIIPDEDIEYNSGIRVVTKEEFINERINKTRENISLIKTMWDAISNGHNFILKTKEGSYYSVEGMDKIINEP